MLYGVPPSAGFSGGGGTSGGAVASGVGDAVGDGVGVEMTRLPKMPVGLPISGVGNALYGRFACTADMT